MIRERVVLTFSGDAVEEPVTWKLVREYDLWINILRAEVDPGQEGRLLLELSGSEENLASAKEYLADNCVCMQPVSDKLTIDRDKCCDCGACTGVCVSRALSMEQDELAFDSDKCILCELCMNACPVKALSAVF